MNIFGTVLTYTAPSANYRGEREPARAVIQRVTSGRFEYAVISPEAMRNALREILRGYGLPSNRERLHNQEQLAVRFAGYPYPERYVDDFVFGYMVADRKQVPADKVKERAQQLGLGDKEFVFPFKRDSVFRMNLALALEPYRHDALFTQSPLTIKNPDAPWQNATSSALLHRETAVTAFQYPFALNLNDWQLTDPQSPLAGVSKPAGGAYASRGEQFSDWLRHTLRAISELDGVAGNHARSLFPMAPASVVLRVTDRLTPQYDIYAFRPDGSLPEIVEGILEGDYPGGEFILGGRLVKEVLDAETREQLREKGADLHRMAADALNAAARSATGSGFSETV